jgi:hypothetical protein
MVRQRILFLEIDPYHQSNVTMNCLKGKIILKGPKTEVEKFKKELMEKIKQVKVIRLDRQFPEHFARNYIKHPRVQQIIGTEVVLFFPFKKSFHDDENVRNDGEHGRGRKRGQGRGRGRGRGEGGERRQDWIPHVRKFKEKIVDYRFTLKDLYLFTILFSGSWISYWNGQRKIGTCQTRIIETPFCHKKTNTFFLRIQILSSMEIQEKNVGVVSYS